MMPCHFTESSEEIEFAPAESNEEGLKTIESVLEPAIMSSEWIDHNKRPSLFTCCGNAGWNSRAKTVISRPKSDSDDGQENFSSEGEQEINKQDRYIVDLREESKLELSLANIELALVQNTVSSGNSKIRQLATSTLSGSLKHEADQLIQQVFMLENARLRRPRKHNFRSRKEQIEQASLLSRVDKCLRELMTKLIELKSMSQLDLVILVRAS